jgi:hypothetical protein
MRLPIQRRDAENAKAGRAILCLRVLDCGGRAQRRHRFGAPTNVVKAAWRFASRRTPKSWVVSPRSFHLCVKMGIL